MLNRGICENKLMDKFKNLTLHAIVNEAFITALPFSKDDLSSSDIKALSMYSLKVLEAVGGFNKATESVDTLKDIKHKAFLTDILSTCEASALEATKRIAANQNYKDPKVKVDDIVDKAAFTQQEYDKFKNSAKNIDAQEIGKIINEKTIAAIKSEKEIQAQDDELKQELSDALLDSKDFKETTLESYLDLILDANDVRTPVTFFSKLIEASYENLLYTKEEYTEIPFETLNRITFDGTLKSFKRKKTPIECLEALISVNTDPAVIAPPPPGPGPAPMPQPQPDGPHDGPRHDDCGPKPQLMDTAMVCSIIIYTILEVLKTLHIYSPSTKEVEQFIKNTPSCKDIIAQDRDTFVNHCNNSISEIRNYCMKHNEPDELVAAREQLNDIKDKMLIDTYDDTSYLTAKSNILTSIESVITEVTAKINNINNGKNTKKELTSFEKRAVESDLSEINRINSLYGSNVNVTDICLLFDPTAESVNFIDVQCKNTAGQTVAQSFIPISYKPTNVEQYVKESFNNSKLASSNKNIFLCYNNGTGKKIPLK